MRQKICNFNCTVQLLSLVVVLYIGTTRATAQVHTNGSLHVAANSILFVNSSAVTFGASSATTTSKTPPYAATDGKIILGSTATFSTDGAASKFVNGYAGTFNTTETTLAIGAGTGMSAVYAPIKVTATTNNVSTNRNVHAAYFNATPPTITNTNILVSAIANTEYWIVKGEDAILSLSWRTSSNLNAFTTSLVGVTIVGLNTSANQWQVIDSNPESGASLSSGFIKSTSAIDLDAYSAFAIGEKGVECANLITSSGSTKTWNGTSWTGGTPTIEDPAVLGDAYSGPSFACNSLDLATFDVTLTGTNSLEVNGAITGTTGKIIMSSEASLVQRDKTAAAPVIELTKTTRAIRRFDYVYWGSPVTTNVFSQLAAAQVTGNATGAFDLMYSYTSGILGAFGGWQALTATTNGRGFITRVKQQAPFTDATTTGQINLKFTGTANNGDLTVPIAKVANNNTSSRNQNLLANPYPSAIDADKFLTENNALIDGVIYLWRANTSNPGSVQPYAVADYIAYTKAGSAGYTGTTLAADANFNGFIASGQGFKVKALTAGTAKFTNCMRVVTGNNQFYRTNEYATENTTIKDRFKVNLANSSGIANQVLIAYLPQTTLAYDNMYDAELLSVSPTRMYTILDNDTKKLAINARPTFNTTDQVAVGYTKADATATQMSIQVTDKEGVFANNQTQIFLHDTQLNTYHNFANGAYSFNATAQVDDTRFKIVYQNSILGTTDFDANQIVASLHDKLLTITSKVSIEEVQVYDMMGRLVTQQTLENQATSFEADFLQAVGVYAVKVKLTNGQLVTTKLINKN
jgi:hypothetical protein